MCGVVGEERVTSGHRPGHSLLRWRGGSPSHITWGAGIIYGKWRPLELCGEKAVMTDTGEHRAGVLECRGEKRKALFWSTKWGHWG